MGIYFHAISKLDPPLGYVRELTNLIPKEGKLSVGSRTFKILIALHGSVSMEVSPKLKFSLEERDIIVLPKPCQQVYRPLGPDSPHTFQTLVIMFDYKLIFGSPKRWGDTLAAQAAQLCRENFPAPVKISGGSIQELDYLVSEIREESGSRLPGKHVRVHALICALLVDIVRATAAEARPAKPVRGNRKLLVHLAGEFMFKNLSRPLTAGEIAWHLRMSQEHLSRVFKAETGFTLKHYLGMMRVKHAKNLLLESNLPITQISEACGFSTRALFYRAFRQFLKMTPAEYRKSNQGAITHHWVTPTTLTPRRAKGA